QCHLWGGKFRRVRADFVIPNCPARHPWILWMCSNKEKQVPPLRQLDGHGMSTCKMQKRLRQLRYVMSKYELNGVSKGLQQECRPLEAATQPLIECQSSAAVDDTTECSRKRRRGQLSWTVVGKLLRKKQKQQQVC
ncbi:hypothetical protein PHMEG_00029016, partial [Phytophthora megakarya]